MTSKEFYTQHNHAKHLCMIKTEFYNTRLTNKADNIKECKYSSKATTNSNSRRLKILNHSKEATHIDSQETTMKI